MLFYIMLHLKSSDIPRMVQNNKHKMPLLTSLADEKTHDTHKQEYKTLRIRKQATLKLQKWTRRRGIDQIIAATVFWSNTHIKK